MSRTPVRKALFTLQSEGLVELTPNRGATVRTINAHDVQRIYALRAYPEERALRVNEQHRAILAALLDRDADRAEKAMREHVEASSQFALEHFRDADHPRAGRPGPR